MSQIKDFTPTRVTPAEAAALVEAARRVSGVAVSAQKRDFIELRLGRRLREINCPDYASYLRLVRGPDGGEETRHLVEALTTHTTSFFREKGHYDWLEAEALPALYKNGAGRERPLTIWSAACSLGSEMWTAAMVLDRFAGTCASGFFWSVVGTDISRRILRRAAAALFTESELAGLPEELRRRHLLRSRGPVSGQPRYRIAPELRAKGRLAYANLVEMDLALKLDADVAFLRNVLIYFEPEQQRRAVTNVLRRLRPGGYLLTGHSESIGAPPAGLRQIAPSTYQKV